MEIVERSRWSPESVGTRKEDSVGTSVWGDKTAGTLSLGEKEQSSAEHHWELDKL